MLLIHLVVRLCVCHLFSAQVFASVFIQGRLCAESFTLKKTVVAPRTQLISIIHHHSFKHFLVKTLYRFAARVSRVSLFEVHNSLPKPLSHVISTSWEVETRSSFISFYWPLSVITKHFNFPLGGLLKVLTESFLFKPVHKAAEGNLNWGAGRNLKLRERVGLTLLLLMMSWFMKLWLAVLGLCQWIRGMLPNNPDKDFKVKCMLI